MNPPLGRFGNASCCLGGPPPAPSAEEIKYEQEVTQSFASVACSDTIAQVLKQATDLLERCLTDKLFWRRHPSRRGKRLPQSGSAGDRALVKEWESLRKDFARPAVASQIRSMTYSLITEPRESRCRWLKLEYLTDALRSVQYYDAAKDTKDVNYYRNWVMREANEVSVNAEVYAEAGCPPAKLQALVKEAERLTWPNDQQMENQRIRLFAALQRALTRAAAK